MLIFDVKIDFTRKSRMVARGNQTLPPSLITYSLVVSKQSVRIAFLVATLNDLYVSMFNISNTYLMAPAAENLYTMLGRGFVKGSGKIEVIITDIYGLKSSGTEFCKFFTKTLMDLDFKSCFVDVDVWRKPGTKLNGDKYYEYVLAYLDDCLVILENLNWVMQTLTKEMYNYKLKDVGKPTKYLGT